MSHVEQANRAVIRRLVGSFRLRDGRIAHAWSLEDTLSRLRRLGLTDARDPGGRP
jgi:uncharacterized membrane protein YecN with MAPEG domain